MTTLPSAANPLEDTASDPFTYVYYTDTIHASLILVLAPTAHARGLVGPWTFPLLFSAFLASLALPPPDSREYIIKVSSILIGE